MIISVINHTHGKISDENVQRAIRAINRQIHEDFEPYWSLGAQLRLEGKSGANPTKQTLPDMRGDAVLYLWDGADVQGAIGYHDANNSGIPYGFVFTEIAKQINEPWSVTLSHEALELIADPEANLLVMGPHPAHPNRIVFHWYEMCDAVQAETYMIDSVWVSNFVLPLYFTVANEIGSRNDFLGKAHAGSTLSSFSTNPGGYVGFFDPELNDWDTYSMKGDKVAARRMEIKKVLKIAQRANQYRAFGARSALSRSLGRRGPLQYVPASELPTSNGGTRTTKRRRRVGAR